MERLKSLVSIALEMDHRKLSDAIKDDTTSIRASAIAIEAGINTLHTAVRDAQSLQHYQAILEWLSPTDFPAQQHDIISRRQEGTAQWFLDSAEFKEWLQGSNKTLFCPGIPGAGKTMMAAITIEHLCRTAQPEVGLAYLFCNYNSQVNQSVHGLLSALLKQLVQSRMDLIALVKHLYDHHWKQKSRPSLDEIFTALSTICSYYVGVYFVVDALDECSDQDGTRSRLVEKLHDLQAKTNVRLLFTSRFIPDVTEKFRSDPVLEVRASEEDVKRFVAGQIPRLPKCIRCDRELALTVQSKIVEAVDGMFLLARLHVDSLQDKRIKPKVLSTLEKLTKGAAALDEAYRGAIKRIEEQLAEDRSLARRTIAWVSYAQRPLTSQELCHALAIEPGDIELYSDNAYDVEDIISVCAGLVTIDEESNVIRLVHYTTQEYFERIRSDWNPDAQEEIATTCLTYLAFDTFRSGSCPSDEKFEERIRENVLLDYAGRHWAEHVRPVEATISKLALAFLQNPVLVSCCTQLISVGRYKYRGYSQRFPQATTGLHLSARLGLVLLSRLIFTADCEDFPIDVDSKDKYGRTPLSWAAENGHEAVVKLL
ncbi:hypothetical protein P154DRAFT_527092, partial [Amniculicola lignicola CBS 123094]